MTLPVPQLDDRTFTQLVDEARRRAALTCPDWTDLTAHDPGVTLLEVFAYLTETMLYRLNRLPEKAYVEFLNLLGVQMQPPSAASATLEIRRKEAPATAAAGAAAPAAEAIRIPAGTKVTVGTPTPGEPPPVFTTTQTAVLEAGAELTTVDVHHHDRGRPPLRARRGRADRRGQRPPGPVAHGRTPARRPNGRGRRCRARRRGGSRRAGRRCPGS
jgi:predicted phage baseplate assembly protein